MNWAWSWENRIFAYAKTKTQISFAVTAKLISAFVFAPRIVQFLFYLYPKFQVSSHLLWLYITVCVGPGRKPRRPVFSERGSICLKNIANPWDDGTLRHPLTYMCSLQPCMFYVVQLSKSPIGDLYMYMTKDPSRRSNSLIYENMTIQNVQILKQSWTTMCTC